MRLTDLYKINGNSLVAPDEDIQMSFEDLDAADAGRDESGYMHRNVVRSKVGVWNFVYSHLTQEEYRYMRSILPTDGTCIFTYPDPEDTQRRCSTEAYLSGYSIVWHSARTMDYRNLRFSIIEC